MDPSQPSLFGDETESLYCEVIVELATRSLDRVLTYLVPDGLRDSVRVGSCVRVPLGKQQVSGYVVGLTNRSPAGVTVRALLDKSADEELLDEAQVSLARWLADRYRSTLMEALRCFLPPGATRKPERTVELTDLGRTPGAGRSLEAAVNQARVLAALVENDGRNVWELGRLFGGGKEGVSRAGAAVRALAAKGLVREVRRLKRPAAGPKTRQVAYLSDSDHDWVALLERLSSRAPRQAEALSSLLAADGDAVPMADLPRDAVRALERDGLAHVAQERVLRAPQTRGFGGESAHALDLNPAQRVVVERVTDALSAGHGARLLLHGVTGSGKTEVYLQSIQAATEMGRSAIVLVPEISLTPQAVGRFRARFGDRLALLHSALSTGERFDEWMRIRSGEADIVVGARSAVFAPCRNLGIIVVDEEHERAYKQDSEPRYAAQVVAAQRAAREGAVLLMGSATPSVEAYYHATEGDGGIELVHLPERIDDRPMPRIEIVDLRQEPRDSRHEAFSEKLVAALNECVEAGDQAIVFLNRRGFSTFVMCRDCGLSLQCPDCAVSLTYHHQSRRLRCHHCDRDEAVPERCPNCDGYDIGFHGMGTERVVDQLERAVPGARALRMDRDTTAQKNAYDKILRRFAAGEANVLVGTQMIAKGHDFPDVTLVGVLNADTGLNRPDFRAGEQTFQILTQVAGRAGRGNKDSRVIVQTFNPEHYAVTTACDHDYQSFISRELAYRRLNRYPPFAGLVRLVFSDEDEQRALDVARGCAVTLQELGLAHQQGAVHFMGPAEAPLHKLRGQFRYHLLLKGPDAEAVRRPTDALIERLGDTGSTAVVVDIDPTDMM